MPVSLDGGKRCPPSDLQDALHALAAVLADAQLLEPPARTAFASLAERMIVHGFASELSVLEARRWMSEDAT